MSTLLPLYIQLLGNFRLMHGDEPISSVNTPRLQSLLAYLVLHRDAPLLRQHLAFQLWPDSSESQARTNLRKLFFQLQHALPHTEHFLQADTQTIGWKPDAPMRLDVAELQRCLTHLEKEPLDLDGLRQVVDLYQGQLLPSCYDDWIAPLRQQLHQRVMSALERLLILLENQRAYDMGIRYAQRLLAFDPLEEKTYQRLMRLHALEGDYPSALRVYQECVAVLQRELDVEPAAETKELYERLRQRDSALGPKPEQKLPQMGLLPLIGRQREWQTLQHAWRKAMQGQTHYVCIWGEAGIGKTRLAEELLVWASRQGILTARTRSYAAQGALAYAPVTELLRSSPLRPRLATLGDLWLTQVARLLPELLAEHPSLPPPQPMTESWQRLRFFEALARAVLADDQPLLLAFDDLHWCDRETLEWLHYLLHFAPQARLLLVGTSRVEEVAADHPLTTLRLALGREALSTEFELTPLSAVEVTALAQEIATDNLSPEQMKQLYADTAGNPLFVVETVRSRFGKEEGEWEDAGEVQPLARLPSKVYAVIQLRLSQLSPQAQKLAGLAAVIGRSFTFALLTAAAHEDEDTIIASLDELGERRIIREQGAEGYDFSHDRMRDVAYAELSRARRRQLHRRVAEALETVYASTLDEISAQLAAHYEQAGVANKAAYYWRGASERALAQFAQLDAIRYLSRALELVPTDDWQQQYDLLLIRVKIYDHQGMRAEGKRDFETLQTLVSIHDDGTPAAIRRRAEVALCVAEYGRGIADYSMARVAAQEAAVLAEQCEAVGLAAQAYFLWGEADFWEYDHFAQARPQVERALVLARAAGLHQIEAQALTTLVVHSLYSGGLVHQIEAVAQQCLAAYQKLGDPTRQAGGLGVLAYIIYTQREGNYDLGIRYCERALQLASGGGWWDAERLVLYILGALWYYQGNYGRARPYLERSVTITRQAQNRQFEASSLLDLGNLYLGQGDYAHAKVHLEQSLRLFREKGSQQQYRVKVLGHLALLSHALGENTQASAYGEEAVGFARKLNDPRVRGDALTRWGRVLVSQGRLAEADELFQQALADFRQMEQYNHALMSLAGLAEVALRSGDLAQAHSWVEPILTHLPAHELDRTDEELYVYMVGYRVLRAAKDARAAHLLSLAHEQLKLRAATLTDANEQRMFWSAPPHSEVVAEMKRNP